MRLLSLALSMAALGAAAACGSSEGAAAGGTAPPVTTGGDAGTRGGLGMNDATVLVPLPASVAQPVILRGSDTAADGSVLVPRALFDRLVDAGSPMPLVPPDEHGKLHLVAIRVDLCDRTQPGECPRDVDGRLRLVFQPLTDDFGAHDVGVHAFYTIPKSALPDVVGALRELAAIQGEPTSSPLRVSPALSGERARARAGEYATKLRALVREHGGETKLTRLTLNAQPIFFSAIRWAMRGIERRDPTGAFVAASIGGGAPEISQDVTLFGSASYTATPATDTPVGLLDALSQTAFEGKTRASQRSHLEVLAAVDNPLLHAPDTVACIACHASTVAMSARAKTAGIDAATVSGGYTSAFDTSIAAGKSASTERTIRALGWLGRDPMISQRVANDTAQVLREIDARFPAQ